jgi:hypothetical protein
MNCANDWKLAEKKMVKDGNCFEKSDLNGGERCDAKKQTKQVTVTMEMFGERERLWIELVNESITEEM